MHSTQMVQPLSLAPAVDPVASHPETVSDSDAYWLGMQARRMPCWDLSVIVQRLLRYNGFVYQAGSRGPTYTTSFGSASAPDLRDPATRAAFVAMVRAEHLAQPAHNRPASLAMPPIDASARGLRALLRWAAALSPREAAS